MANFMQLCIKHLPHFTGEGLYNTQAPAYMCLYVHICMYPRMYVRMCVYVVGRCVYVCAILTFLPFILCSIIAFQLTYSLYCYLCWCRIVTGQLLTLIKKNDIYIHNVTLVTQKYFIVGHIIVSIVGLAFVIVNTIFTLFRWLNASLQ